MSTDKKDVIEKKPYYVIKPTTHAKQKVEVGEVLILTESQARPLRNGGFVTPDQIAAERVRDLLQAQTANAQKAEKAPTKEGE